MFVTVFMIFSNRVYTPKFLIKFADFHKSKTETTIKNPRLLLITTRTGIRMLRNNRITFSILFFFLYFFLFMSFALAGFSFMKAIQGTAKITNTIRTCKTLLIFPEV
jgi:hypothetical protein